MPIPFPSCIPLLVAAASLYWSPATFDRPPKLVGLADILAMVPAAIGAELTEDAAKDSTNYLNSMLGAAARGKQSLVSHSNHSEFP